MKLLMTFLCIFLVMSCEKDDEAETIACSFTQSYTFDLSNTDMTSNFIENIVDTTYTIKESDCDGITKGETAAGTTYELERWSSYLFLTETAGDDAVRFTISGDKLYMAPVSGSSGECRISIESNGILNHLAETINIDLIMTLAGNCDTETSTNLKTNGIQKFN